MIRLVALLLITGCASPQLIPNGKIGVDLNGPFYCATHADKPICRKVAP